jgi:hypothetical protein
MSVSEYRITPEDAEFGLLIKDKGPGRGLGKRLHGILVTAAQHQRVVTFRASILFM